MVFLPNKPYIGGFSVERADQRTPLWPANTVPVHQWRSQQSQKQSAQ